MWVRLTACLVWAILALSAVYWSFKLLVRPSGMPAHALLVATDQAARGDPLRLFAAPPQLATRPRGRRILAAMGGGSRRCPSRQLFTR